jgi:hypothetical protein
MQSYTLLVAYYSQNPIKQQFLIVQIPIALPFIFYFNSDLLVS